MWLNDSFNFLPSYVQCTAHFSLNSLSIRWNSQRSWIFLFFNQKSWMPSFISFFHCKFSESSQVCKWNKWGNEGNSSELNRRGSIPKKVFVFQWRQNWKQNNSYYWQRCWKFYWLYSLDLSQIGCQRFKWFPSIIRNISSSAETDNSWSIALWITNIVFTEENRMRHT